MLSNLLTAGACKTNSHRTLALLSDAALTQAPVPIPMVEIRKVTQAEIQELFQF